MTNGIGGERGSRMLVAGGVGPSEEARGVGGVGEAFGLVEVGEVEGCVGDEVGRVVDQGRVAGEDEAVGADDEARTGVAVEAALVAELRGDGEALRLGKRPQLRALCVEPDLGADRPAALNRKHGNTRRYR